MNAMLPADRAVAKPPPLATRAPPEAVTLSELAPATPRPRGRVLLVDDDATIAAGFRIALEIEGYFVEWADNARDGAAMAARQRYDVCLLDIKIGIDSGLELLPRLVQLVPGMRVIMVTGESQTDTALAAFDAGASDYLVKPCTPEQLMVAVARQLHTRRLEARVETLEREVAVQRADAGDLRSQAPAMQAAIEIARQVATTDANVLLLGDSGTGKGVLARAIHGWSSRRDAEFVNVNCPSLSTELLESELFGHQKGAFTGATQSSVGRVALADGGTLFLDEIGDFSLHLQPKLLRFIQDKEYERLGDPVTRRADVRLIAATNRDVQAMVREGTFRQDLYYRLNVIAITLPPLRERGEDISDIAQRLLQRFAANHRRPARRFSEAAMHMVCAYPWPGNVRELQNVVERAAILCPGELVEPSHLAIGSIAASGEPGAVQSTGSDLSLEQLEHIHIRQVLARTDSLDSAARILGIDASTLYRKRKASGLI